MKALIIVDPLNDFADPKGSLYVKGGQEIIEKINDISDDYDTVILIQDWHPANHKSFASNNDANLYEMITLNGIPQVMWPDHGIQDTWGSEPHPGLKKNWKFIIKKGKNPELDSYSAFYENDQKTKTELTSVLNKLRVTEVDIVGLATDFCVKFTAMDAIKDGFIVNLLTDCIRGVNIEPDDSDLAIYEMGVCGVNIL